MEAEPAPRMVAGVMGVARRVLLQEQPAKKPSIVDAMMLMIKMLPPLVRLHRRLVADPAAELENVGADSMKWQQNLWSKSWRQMMRARWRSPLKPSSSPSSRWSHPGAEEEESSLLGQERKRSFRVGWLVVLMLML